MIRRAATTLVVRHFGEIFKANRTAACRGGNSVATAVRFYSSGGDMVDKEELRKRLTPLQYQVTQEKGTERPFTGCYNKTYDKGTYVCICCEQPLFSSDTKYDSGCGWPAFNDVLDQGKVKLSPDTSGGRIRTEVTCSKCDAHLGHVFGDGPPRRRRGSASIPHQSILFLTKQERVNFCI